MPIRQQLKFVSAAINVCICRCGMNPSSLYEMRHSIVQAVSDYVDIEAEELVEVGSCYIAEISRARHLWSMQCSWAQTVLLQRHMRYELCCCE